MPYFKKAKLLYGVALTLLGLCYPYFLYALPEIDNVREGQVQIETPDPRSLNITTFTDKTIINYRQFNIAQNETVRFIQPQVTSVVLNRDLAPAVSAIFGNLLSNGQIILINPYGINIGSSANINVASIIASTLNISDSDFLNGNYKFFKSGEGAFVLNQGNIVVRNGGYVCLLAGAVENQGTILANLGTVVLASGEKMTLALDDLNQISVVIDEAVKEGILGIDSAIKNSGTISANGGKVILTAKVLNNVFDYAINNSGIIEAKSVVNYNGVIELVAEGAPIVNSGSLIAGEVKINTDSGFINTNIGKVTSDSSIEVINAGKVSIVAATVLQQGLISANAFETGTAGEIIIVSQTSTILDTGSTTEAMALGLAGNGGRILINSTGGNTTVNTNAVIDVSAGAISGNAGFIEISAFDQLGFYGVLNGRAPPGYQGADVFLKTNLPFNPSLVNIYALIIDAEITAGNISIFTNQRLSIAGILTAQDTIQIDSQGADISGNISSPIGIFNMHTGDTDISEDVTFTGDLAIVDVGNIKINANITGNGDLKILADHTSSDLNSWHDGDGDLTHNQGTIQTTGSGSITLAGANVYLYSTDTVISDSGDINVVANNSSPGNHSTEIEVWGAISSNSGNINLTTTNTVNTISDDYEFSDYSDNYVIIEVYNDISSGSGSITLEAINTVNKTISGLDGAYEDGSDNYAWIYVEGSGSLSAPGGISLEATNTVTRDITGDYLDYYYDDSENYALVDIYDTLSTVPGVGTSSGEINLTANNTVTNNIGATSDSPDTKFVEIWDYYDESENYAEIWISTGETIESSQGAINIVANNRVSRNVASDSMDYSYNYAAIEDYSDNHAYIDVGDSLITSNKGAIGLTATNNVNNTFNVQDEIYGYYDDSGADAEIYIDSTEVSSNTGNISLSAYNSFSRNINAGYLEWLRDYLDNYAEVDIYNPSPLTISTTGNIDFSVDNSVTREISADNIDYFRDSSDNYAYIYVYGTLDTTSDGTSPGTVTITATNSVDNTVTVNDNIGDYYDYSDNYAEIYLESSGTISTDLGDVNITADNTFMRNVNASYIDYFRDSSENYAKLYLWYNPIYSGSGDITLSALNTVDTPITAVDPEGTLYYYYDSSDNYAEVEVYNYLTTISTKGNINVSATNTVNKDTTAESVTYYGDFSYNYADIDITDTLTTTPDGAESEGEINITSTNTVNNTLNSNNVGDSDNYAEVELFSDSSIYSDTGGVNITATSTGSGWHEAYVYIYTPIISDSANINVYSTGDINVYADLIGNLIKLFADADEDGYGDLYGETVLTGYNHTLGGAGDFELYGDEIRYYSYLEDDYTFASELVAPFDLEDLEIISTTNDIYIEGPVNRSGDANIDLIAGDDIYVNAPISTENGYINLEASGNDEDSSIINISSTVSTASGDINMTADDYEIGGDTIISETGDITLENASAGRPIALGYNSDADDLEIDAGEVARIITDGLITIGSSTAGPITVGSADFDDSLVALISGDDINGWEGSVENPNLVASVLYLVAAGNIGDLGSDSDLVTDINYLYAYAGGWINIYDIGSLTLVDVQGGLGEEVYNYTGTGNLYEEVSVHIGHVEFADVYIFAINNIDVDYVYDPLYVYLESYNGSINGIETGSANIETGVLEIYAATGIGTSDNPLNIQINTLSAETISDGASLYIIDEFGGIGIVELITGGNVIITANGSSTVGSITTGGDFSFTTSTGAITVLTGTVESLGGGITLIALDGSIIAIGPGPHLVAADDSLLEASGVIGSTEAPFDVFLSAGDLFATIGSASGGISGVFSGTLPANTIILNNTPPGAVLLNSIQLWPPLTTGTPTYLLNQYVNSLVWRVLLSYLEVMAQSQINSFNPGGPVYLYHPLTDIDMAAFDKFILEEGAYEFIEGAINIVGHDGLLPILEEIQKRPGQMYF